MIFLFYVTIILFQICNILQYLPTPSLAVYSLYSVDHKQTTSDKDKSSTRYVHALKTMENP